MKIIITAAGAGKRFSDAGYEDPKPLIHVNGIPMIGHVVSMFSPDDEFIFICSKEHLENTKMRLVLEKIAPNVSIVSVKPHNLGPVNSVMSAFSLVNDDEPVIVCYCDFYEWWDYGDFKKTVLEAGCDAAVTAYTGFHPHLLGDSLYASMRISDNWMLECREKYSFTANKMDCFHQTGKFYFAKGSMLKKFFFELIEKNLHVNNEYYVSIVTQLMQEAGLKIYVYPVEHFLQWGTPKDLEEYHQWSDYFSGGKIPENYDERTMNYWKSFFFKCPWHPYGVMYDKRNYD